MKKLILLGIFAFVIMHSYVAPTIGANHTNGPKLELTFYYLPGDPIGKRVRLSLHELKKRQGGLVDLQILDATSDANRSKQAGYGFKNHGLIIEDDDSKIIFKQADHHVYIDEVNDFVNEYLKKHKDD